MPYLISVIADGLAAPSTATVIDGREAITQAHREEWARVISALAKRFGDLDIAEAAAQMSYHPDPPEPLDVIGDERLRRVLTCSHPARLGCGADRRRSSTGRRSSHSTTGSPARIPRRSSLSNGRSS
jgi:hypothetical protein